MNIRATTPFHRRVLTGMSVVLLIPALSGCSTVMDGISGGIRNEQKGPDGVLVAEAAGLGYYKPAKLVPPGKTTYRIASIPKTYEVLLDLNEGTDKGVQAQQAEALTRASLGQQISGNYLLGAVQVDAGSGERVDGDYGAAIAWRRTSGQHAVYTRGNLTERVTADASVDLYFIHELVSVEEPEEEVSLQPFGKVLSVTTANDGAMTSQTREPVYTICVPARHRLVVIAKDPANGAELSKAVYATWTKKHWYFRPVGGKDKTFFADEAAARSSYETDKAAFAAQIAKSDLFDSRKPKNLQELPVTDLSVLSPDEAWGSLISSSHPLPYVARPPTSDAATVAWKTQATWFTWDDAQHAWHLRPQFIHDPTWIPAAIVPLSKVRDDQAASTVARSAAALTIATYEACLIDGAAATAQVAKAQQIAPDCLEEASSMSRGGMLDYGVEYYMSRYYWLGLARTVSGIEAWSRQGVQNATVNPTKN